MTSHGRRHVGIACIALFALLLLCTDVNTIPRVWRDATMMMMPLLLSAEGANDELHERHRAQQAPLRRKSCHGRGLRYRHPLDVRRACWGEAGTDRQTYRCTKGEGKGNTTHKNEGAALLSHCGFSIADGRLLLNINTLLLFHHFDIFLCSMILVFLIHGQRGSSSMAGAT